MDVNFSETTIQPASFYPNLFLVLKVRVCDNPEVPGTTDVMTSNFEIRHFIDRAYLNSLPEGPELLNNLAVPAPPCSRLTGTRRQGGERVIGMLKKRLRVALFCEDGATYDPNSQERRDSTTDPMEKKHHPPGWVAARLQNVLVVDEMPVPIHVSMKGIGLFPNFSCGGSGGLAPEKFPVRYRGHPYWGKDSTIAYVGALGPGADALQSHIAKSATGRPDKVTSGACLSCGKKKQFACSRCRAAAYCSKECQRKDWKEGGHKQACVALKGGR